MNSADDGTMIESLRKSSSLGDKPFGRRLLETHISWVILAGDFAYKIKKPVNLGFLDFSTLEKRRHYCEEELRLNQRLAAEYYLDVLPVTRDESGWRIGGEGAPVEYAVRMKRFQTRMRLDRMLTKKKLRGHHLDAFAGLVADFHMHRVAVSHDRGTAEQVCAPARDNFSQIRQVLDGLEPDVFPELEEWNARACKRYWHKFEARRKQGWIRECHGDLHLGNMAWTPSGPLIFDCIEFNPDLRWIDVLSEVAFLVMDLHAHENEALAWRFLNRYLERTGDYLGLELLPFYLAYRAMVRAKIAAIRVGQLTLGTGLADEFLKVDHYCLVAWSFTRMNAPRLLITHGLSGSGKSSFSAQLMQKAGCIRIRSDVERKRLFNLDMDESARATPDSGIYTPEASERVYAHLLVLAEAVLDAGFSVIVDAAFLREEQRRPFMELAQAKGMPFLIVALQASPDILRKRVARRKNDVSDADLAVLESQLADYAGLSPEEQAVVLEVNTQTTPDWNSILARLEKG
ncbi:bifunctional aminoglycoside phosphotransferase/ATP-binding protein [Thiolapillus sp.]